MTLGKTLKERRLVLELTQRQIAIALGITESTIYNWEQDIHMPRLTPVQMKTLCDLLEMSLDQLAAAVVECSKS